MYVRHSHLRQKRRFTVHFILYDGGVNQAKLQGYISKMEIEMIGYQIVGTNKFEESAAFYDALLGELGASRMMEMDNFIAWSATPGQPAFSISKPHDGNDASIGNGSMTALVVDSHEKVDQIYAKALELGGTCEGPAGPRGEGGFYAGYFRDLDGNKLNVFCMG